MIYLGIDPGLTGAIARLHVHPDGTQTLGVLGTPTVWRMKGQSRRREYDLPALDYHLAHQPPITLAYIEQQSARPGQGVVSMFSTGYGAGMWLAFLTAHQIPYVLIHPRRWRFLVGLPDNTRGTAKKDVKNNVRLAACRRFPAIPINLDHADAVMLAVAAALEHGAERQGITG